MQKRGDLIEVVYWYRNKNSRYKGPNVGTNMFIFLVYNIKDVRILSLLGPCPRKISIDGSLFTSIILDK